MEQEIETLNLEELTMEEKALELREIGMDVSIFPARKLIIGEKVKWMQLPVPCGNNGSKKQVFFLDIVLKEGTATIGLDVIKAQRLMRALQDFTQIY